MSFAAPSTSPADRLIGACWTGDLPLAAAAVADGAVVNEVGGDAYGGWLPLTSAVYKKQPDVVVWLLSLGANPNGNRIMMHGAINATAEILQLLIDAGGDVNRKTGGLVSRDSVGSSLLCMAVYHRCVDSVRVLLAQPRLSDATLLSGRSEAMAAREPDLESAISEEVGV